jgi:hypothetical protein
MASVVPIGFRMRRKTKVFCRSPLSTSSSSFRVPDLRMSIAGKTRLSATFRSRTISELPVPLNSSKMTSSIRLPVSIRAVAMMVSAAALLDVPRGAEEPLRPLQCVGVHTAGQNLARGWNHGVEGTPQTRDRVEQDDDVALVLHQALGLFDDHFGDLAT